MKMEAADSYETLYYNILTQKTTVFIFTAAVISSRDTLSLNQKYNSPLNAEQLNNF
jgi:hypothetical protein